jgi:predicted SnoaL-like aldol condensation-catalyzing enzyme
VSEADITATNKALVLKAITGCFVDRDTSIPGKHFAPDYKQHNPSIPSGNAAIPALITALNPEFKYELGMIVAEGEYVMIHGRYNRLGPEANGRSRHLPCGRRQARRALGRYAAELTKSGNGMFTNPQRG